ncbi:MAG: hypothetical protein M3082_22605 [Candidatus Dormibacteraeota bacterium]|nr:hypothetical protein [Candidatus Dormibacteraeota bacterium]
MNLKLPNPRVLRIAGLAAGAAAVSGAAVLVTASAAGYNLPFLTHSSQPTSGNVASLDQKGGQVSALCSEFVSYFSADLNTTQAAVNAAFQKAIAQTLADEVKNGKLNQKQADTLKLRLAGQAPCAIADKLKVPAGGTKLAAYKQALLSAAASALGITDTALKTDLAQGMTLSQIAAAQQPAVTESAFRSRLIASLTRLLDKAVAANQLTSTQEKSMIDRLQTGPIPYWTKPMHGGNPTATPTPAGSTT